MTQPILEVHNLRKQYGDFTAVDDLSFAVLPQDIFGLLGPNGAGKTTTIRIVMDIFKADGGAVRILDAPPGTVRERVGYLPEERGLYRDLRVLETLVYLAELKGTSRSTAQDNALHWLERVELSAWADKKVKDLSRGMQQKLQFVASLIHDPELLILDEPFQGLDPVNVELIKGLIRELREAGKTIVLSAHQMNLVEEMCNRIVLINRGRAVLYGDLGEIKRTYAPQTVRVGTPTPLPDLPGVVRAERRGPVTVLELGQTSPQEILAELVRRNVPVESFEVATAPLNDIFMAVVRGSQHLNGGQPSG